MSESSSYVSTITGYYLENLPRELLDLFVPQRCVSLAESEMKPFAAVMGLSGVRRNQALQKDMQLLVQRLAMALRKESGDTFIRLGSSSPKDSLYPLRCSDINDFFLILKLSYRAFADVQWAYMYNYPVSIFIRPWMDIQEWQEIRCIIKQKEIYGISQYYTEAGKAFLEIEQQKTVILDRLLPFIREKILVSAPHESFVCDILYPLTPQEPLLLIDYNPLTALTGMCFFDKSFPQADRPEFRFWSTAGLRQIPL